MTTLTAKNIIATATLLLADVAWVSTFMSKRYRQMIPKIQKGPMQTNVVYAVLAYMLMVAGLNLFVLPNIRPGYELEDSLRYGFTFGAIAYGIFDFTNATVLKDWDISLAIVDVLWGGFVYFLAAYTTRFV